MASDPMASDPTVSDPMASDPIASDPMISVSIPATRRRPGCALVTGSSSGIGAQVTRQLLAQGWRVIGLDRAAATIDDDAFESIECDLSDPPAVATWLSQQREVDCWVHAAGFMHTAALGALCSTESSAMWRVHVVAAELLANQLLPAMAARGYGRAVLVGSRVAAGFPGRSQYAATKAALVSLARSWASETVRRGVTVNVVSPAATDTPMLDCQARASSRPLSPPMGRLITASEVASLIAYLVSDSAAAITGQELVICGGSSLPGVTAS